MPTWVMQTGTMSNKQGVASHDVQGSWPPAMTKVTYEIQWEVVGIPPPILWCFISWVVVNSVWYILDHLNNFLATPHNIHCTYTLQHGLRLIILVKMSYINYTPCHNVFISWPMTSLTTDMVHWTSLRMTRHAWPENKLAATITLQTKS